MNVISLDYVQQLYGRIICSGVKGAGLTNFSVMKVSSVFQNGAECQMLLSHSLINLTVGKLNPILLLQPLRLLRSVLSSHAA